MDKVDLVSIMIPAYNAEKYIGNAISSVLQQTYAHYEVIVVDDASRDRTAEVVRSFGDKRISLIQHVANQGPGATKNTAIEAAKGNWIAILDADDQWEPTRLEKLLRVAREVDYECFVADDALLCFDSPAGLRPWGRQSRAHYDISFGDNYLSDINLFDYLKLGAPIIKPIVPLDHLRKFGLRYNSSCLCGQDLEFYCHLFRTGLPLRFVNEPMYLYRLTPGSLTSRADVHEHLMGVYERLLADVGFPSEVREIFAKRLHRAKSEQKYAPFASALKQSNFGEALRLVTKQPTLLFSFLRRLPKSLKYRIASLRCGGSAR